MNDTYLDSLQAYAEANAPEAQCPHCGEKYLVMRGESEYECNECGKPFWVTFLIEDGKFDDCLTHTVDPAKDPALQKFNDPRRFAKAKPEETTLVHVATTLQFCLEQLQLCEEVIENSERPLLIDYIAEATITVFTALNYLQATGIEPAPLPLEVAGAVPA